MEAAFALSRGGLSGGKKRQQEDMAKMYVKSSMLLEKSIYSLNLNTKILYNTQVMRHDIDS